MAGYRTHVFCGGLWGLCAGAAAFLTGWCTPVQSAILGVFGMIGAGLPDIDGKTSRPRRLLLGVLGVGVPVLLVGRYLPRGATNEIYFCWITGSYLVICFGLDFLLSHFSRHRGAFHSIPAAILAGEGAFLVFAGSTLQARFAFALAVAGGYLSHLLLDELWSVNLFGIAEKKSAGSAFTWKTDSPAGTALLYLAVALLGGFCVF